MTYDSLETVAKRLYRPILILEDVLPYETRNRWTMLLTISLVVLLVLAIVSYVITNSEAAILVFPGLAAFQVASSKVYGLFLIVLALRFCFTALEAFHRSYYFRGLNLVLEELDSDNDVPVSFEVAAIMHYTKKTDVTHGFLTSPYGEDIMIRLGILEEELHTYLETRHAKVPTEKVAFPDEIGAITLPDYAEGLYTADEGFSQFLFKHQLQLSELRGAADWVMRTNRLIRNNERWYSRDVLGRIPGIGKAWGAGEKFHLEKFGHYIHRDPVYLSATIRAHDEDDDTEAIERELSKSRQANVVLVGEEGSGKRSVLAQLAHKIREGHILPPLEHKNIFILDVDSIVSFAKEKGLFEETIRTCLREAADSGDIILVIENIALASSNASTIHSDLVGLLEPYFELPSIQLLVTTAEEQLHQYVENDARVRQYFEIVRLHELDDTALVYILEQRAIRLEQRYQPVFTYQTLTTIATDADRYFTDGVMPDKALDLMEESVVRAVSMGASIVTPQIVEEVIEEKTGIPLGEVTADEQQKLMHLEDELNERVVGQQEAIDAVSGAMRRARSGINDPNRPIGTFLFLGPTGVGKTETAKALANVYFGDDDAMHRLDMSEFQTPDAIDRLIGFSDGRPGRLVSMLKEHPYHVLLLDEFEKADSSVHDLFLRILDEGQFTDGIGHKVNAQNTIIIATSNAGAEMIWEYAETGRDISELNKVLVDQIIQVGIFKPELVNRFDAVILFHPLIENEIKQVAYIQLNKLAERMRSKGVDLVVNDALIDFVGETGYDSQFGGRQMNRTIKESVEQIVADKIISGEIKRGQKVMLSKDDFERYKKNK